MARDTPTSPMSRSAASREQLVVAANAAAVGLTAGAFHPATAAHPALNDTAIQQKILEVMFLSSLFLFGFLSFFFYMFEFLGFKSCLEKFEFFFQILTF